MVGMNPTLLKWIAMTRGEHWMVKGLKTPQVRSLMGVWNSTIDQDLPPLVVRPDAVAAP
jgi:hypothetical protein